MSTKKTVYQVNRILAYSPYPLVTEGQKLDTAADNPFFQYYENNVPTHAVTMADNSTVNLGPIKFLRAVRDGQVNAHNLPQAALDSAQHFMTLARELLFEKVRAERYAKLPSRQRSLWVVESLKELAYWRDRLALGQPAQPTQFVELEVSGKLHRCDASFLIGDSEKLSDSLAKAEKYWSGTMADVGSEPEVLFEGTATVKRIIDPKELDAKE